MEYNEHMLIGSILNDMSDGILVIGFEGRIRNLLRKLRKRQRSSMKPKRAFFPRIQPDFSIMIQENSSGSSQRSHARRQTAPCIRC